MQPVGPRFSHIFRSPFEVQTLSRTSKTTKTWGSPQSQRQSVVFLRATFGKSALGSSRSWVQRMLLRSRSPSWAVSMSVRVKRETLDIESKQYMRLTSMVVPYPFDVLYSIRTSSQQVRNDRNDPMRIVEHIIHTVRYALTDPLTVTEKQGHLESLCICVCFSTFRLLASADFRK